ncbi:hypothetical protein Tco_1475018 [Tanacetum coccineum]
MASMNTRLNIEKLDGNIVQKHGGSKQVGLKQLGSKQVGWNLVDQGDREAEIFQVSNDDTALAQRRLEDKQHEEKTNTDCVVKGAGKVTTLVEKVGANSTYRVPSQEACIVMLLKRRKESMKANLRKLLKYKAWLTRRSPVRGSSIG